MAISHQLLNDGESVVVSDASTHGQVLRPDVPRGEETQRRLDDLLPARHRNEGV